MFTIIKIVFNYKVVNDKIFRYLILYVITVQRVLRENYNGYL